MAFFLVVEEHFKGISCQNIPSDYRGLLPKIILDLWMLIFIYLQLCLVQQLVVCLLLNINQHIIYFEMSIRTSFKNNQIEKKIFLLLSALHWIKYWSTFKVSTHHYIHLQPQNHCSKYNTGKMQQLTVAKRDCPEIFSQAHESTSIRK